MTRNAGESCEHCKHGMPIDHDRRGRPSKFYVRCELKRINQPNLQTEHKTNWCTNYEETANVQTT